MSDKKPGKAVRIEAQPASRVPAFTNIQSIEHNPMEFFVAFGQLVPGIGHNDEPFITVPVRVVMTPISFKDFVRACSENLAKYEASHGVIVSPSQQATVVFDAGKAS